MRIKMREALSLVVILLCVIYILCALWVINDMEKSASAPSMTLAEQQGAAYLQSRAEAEAFIMEYPAVQFEPEPEPVQTPGAESEWLYEYETAEGIRLVSDSARWDERKLASLYNELRQNASGEELYSLMQVTLHARPDSMQDTNALFRGGYTSGLELDLGANHVNIDLPFYTGVLDLYNCDTLTTVDSFARLVSHEYGHLFTEYHMFAAYDGDLAETYYAELRNYESHGLIPVAETADPILYYAYLEETAAEDYMQLLGSPNAIKTVYFPDVTERAAGAEYPEVDAFASGTNASPQMNMGIPLAWQVPGLADYFYSFVEYEPVAASNEIYDAEIAITPVTDEDGNFSYANPQYEVTWKTPYKNATYTLVRAGGGAVMEPIKTVPRGGQARAIIGSAQTEDEEWLRDYFVSGTQAFYVIAKLPDGRYIRSEAMVYTF